MERAVNPSQNDQQRTLVTALHSGHPLVIVRQTREAAVAKLDAISAKVEADGRTMLLASEKRAFDRVMADVEAADARIEQLEAQAHRKAIADDAAARYSGSRAHVGNEAVTYDGDPRGTGPSFIRDLTGASRGDWAAAERLNRHSQEIGVLAEERARAGRPELRDLTRVDGAGGSFVPPLCLIDQYVQLARAARPTADACTRFELPPGTDSIVLPKVSTGTATAIQTADNAAVQETDLTDANLTAPVRTIAGQQDVAIQVLEQSPGNVAEQAIMADLLADYATKLNVQVLNGSGASGQSTGILQTASIGSVAYTDATPTVPEIYPKLASALSTIASARFLGCTHFVMHPRRWAWFCAALDTQNRPLVLPSDGAVNAAGLQVTGDAQGVVGRLLGCTVISDPSIPTTLGGGTEDIIIAARLEDVWLFESAPRFRVLPDVLSANLTVRLQAYGYLAVHAGRYPSAVATVGGTGLIAPTF